MLEDTILGKLCQYQKLTSLHIEKILKSEKFIRSVDSYDIEFFFFSQELTSEQIGMIISNGLEGAWILYQKNILEHHVYKILDNLENEIKFQSDGFKSDMQTLFFDNIYYDDSNFILDIIEIKYRDNKSIMKNVNKIVEQINKFGMW